MVYYIIRLHMIYNHYDYDHDDDDYYYYLCCKRSRSCSLVPLDASICRFNSCKLRTLYHIYHIYYIYIIYIIHIIDIIYIMYYSITIVYIVHNEVTYCTWQRNREYLVDVVTMRSLIVVVYLIEEFPSCLIHFMNTL
jgi:hypothetical protein